MKLLRRFGALLCALALCCTGASAMSAFPSSYFAELVYLPCVVENTGVRVDNMELTLDIGRTGDAWQMDGDYRITARYTLVNEGAQEARLTLALPAQTNVLWDGSYLLSNTTYDDSGNAQQVRSLTLDGAELPRTFRPGPLSVSLLEDHWGQRTDSGEAARLVKHLRNPQPYTPVSFAPDEPYGVFRVAAAYGAAGETDAEEYYRYVKYRVGYPVAAGAKFLTYMPGVAWEGGRSGDDILYEAYVRPGEYQECYVMALGDAAAAEKAWIIAGDNRHLKEQPPPGATEVGHAELGSGFSGRITAVAPMTAREFIARFWPTELPWNMTPPEEAFGPEMAVELALLRADAALLGRESYEGAAPHAEPDEKGVSLLCADVAELTLAPCEQKTLTFTRTAQSGYDYYAVEQKNRRGDFFALYTGAQTLGYGAPVQFYMDALTAPESVTGLTLEKSAEDATKYTAASVALPEELTLTLLYRDNALSSHQWGMGGLFLMLLAPFWVPVLIIVLVIIKVVRHNRKNRQAE